MASQLIERLMGTVSPRIACHAFASVLSEYERGEVTGAQASALFGLSGEDAAEAEALAALLTPRTESVSFGAFATLTNIGTAYDNTPISRGLGIVQVEIGGVSSITFGVRVNKVGSGTQSWQLWNETNSSEVAVIDDAAAAGDNKMLSTTVNFDPALAPGVKVIRVRAKSTTAADDPVYYGASLLMRRAGAITSLTVHEVLMLAESRIGYDTAALVRARLGL